MRETGRPSRRSALLGGAAALAAPALRAATVPGLHADRIVFGQAAALSGPASHLGKGMRDGLLAAFSETNGAGGIWGRRLELVSRDDGYEPERSLRATADLIGEGVFALAGAVGTPTSLAVHPLAAAHGLPFIGPFTGAEGLRQPYRPHIVNIRASYFQETEVMAERLTKDLGFDRIAILYQDDGFGRAGLAGLRTALARRRLDLVEKATFPRNTVAVKTAMLDLIDAKPQAVVAIGPYEPCAAFIALSRKFGFSPVFVNISFVGTFQLARTLGEAGKGVFATQVVPHPDAALPVAAAYRDALQRRLPGEPMGFVSFEGYIVGKAIAAALQIAGRAPHREGLLDAFRAAPMDLGGFRLSFSRNGNQGSDAVFLAMIDRNGGLVSVDRFSVL